MSAAPDPPTAPPEQPEAVAIRREVPPAAIPQIRIGRVQAMAAWFTHDPGEQEVLQEVFLHGVIFATLTLLFALSAFAAFVPRLVDAAVSRFITTSMQLHADTWILHVLKVVDELELLGLKVIGLVLVLYIIAVLAIGAWRSVRQAYER